MPGRRLVLCGRINNGLNNNQKVIIKLFVNRQKCFSDYKKLLANYNLILRLGFATPLIIFSNCLANNISYFIYEYISEDDYQRSSDSKYKLIIEAIANLHAHNIYQSDLHFDNFIINKSKVYYLDLQSLEYGFTVSKNDRRLGDITALNNFALFLAQLDITNQNKWCDYIDYYVNCRNINSNIEEVKKCILLSTGNKLNIRVNNFIKKCQRKSSLIEIIGDNAKNGYSGLKLRDGHAKDFHHESSEPYLSNLISDFMVDPNDFIASYTSSILKDGKTAKVLLIDYKGQQIILKHYLSKNLIMRIIANIKYLFIKPRALQSWLNAHMLSHVGIRTAKPIAVIHKSKYRLIHESYFFMEYLRDFQRLSDLLSDSKLSDKAKYLDKVYELLSYFKTLKIIHRDFKTVNMGFINNKITVLDLDAMQKYNSKLLFNRLKNRDINRLHKCLEES